MYESVGNMFENMSQEAKQQPDGLVQWASYTFSGETGAFPHAVDKNEKDVYLHDEDKIILETHSREQIKYVRGFITMQDGTKFFVKSLQPNIVLVCDEIFCPGMLSSVEAGNIDVIKKTLSPYSYNEGQLSDMEAKLIYDKCIPWNTKNFVNSSPAIYDQIQNYIMESTNGDYEGSPQGYMHHHESRKAVYTIFWGANLGGIMDKIVEEHGNLRFRQKNGWLEPWYNEQPIGELMSQLDKIITQVDTGANQMVKDILSGAKESNATKQASEDTATEFAVAIFQLWYANLYDSNKDVIRAVNLQLYEAAQNNDKATLTAYGESGLRKSMALIYGALPKSGPRWLYEFYDFMYQCVTCEGWHNVAAHKEYGNLFQFLCNGYGESRPEWEQQLPELRKQLFDLGYKHSDRMYETRF